ncbi:MAG: Bcr/CflA family efflux MFS transporter [Alphaproteobacteria bacterium]|nr:Bcr/CflA family efflux MFS transporter [Alphaproteobacteria bacterium]
MLRPNSALVVGVLATLVAFGPISTDLYLPSLPAIAAAFDRPIGSAQLTLSAFLAGIAMAQLFVGALGDQFGRRPTMLVALVLYFGASIGCAHATSIEELIVYRFIQAFGACGPQVLGRAVVRDLHERAEATRMLGYIGAIMGFAPVLSPFIGGYFVVWFGWAANFWFMAGYSAFALIVVLVFVQETMPSRVETALDLRAIFVSFGRVLTHREALSFGVPFCFVYAGMFAFFTGSSYIVINILAVPTEHFARYFGAVILGFPIGAFLAGRLSIRFTVESIFFTGIVLAAVSGTVFAALMAIDVVNGWTVVLPMFGYTIAVGLVNPSGIASVLAPFPDIAGKTSALLGAAQMGLSTVASVAVGLLHDGTAMPTANGVAAVGIAALVSHVLVRSGRPAARH